VSKKKKYSVNIIRNNFYKKKNFNLYYLMEKRFQWMNKFIINNKIKGLEVGTGADFAKAFIKNKNLKTSDFENWKHLDFKKIDAHKTSFKNQSFDFIIAANMLHHLKYPLIFLNEMHRILKKKGKLIMFEPNGSILLRIILFITQHENFDQNIDIWNYKKPTKKSNNPWIGNNAIPDLIFEDKEKFNEYFGKQFKIIFHNKCEFLTFLNSGGVYFKSFYLPLNRFFCDLIWCCDVTLTKLFPSIFALGNKLVLKKL